jgi:hypothetical protein
MSIRIPATDPEAIPDAAALLRSGGVVAFPTETVYGLGAHAFDEGAVARVFALKGRPADNPMIVHVRRVADIGDVAREVPDVARRLLDVFSPGPLTVVLPRRDTLPANVTAGLDTVAVRVPDDAIALALIENADRRLTGDEIDGVVGRDARLEHGRFIEKQFEGVYFTPDENRWLDGAVAAIGRNSRSNFSSSTSCDSSTSSRSCALWPTTFASGSAERKTMRA